MRAGEPGKTKYEVRNGKRAIVRRPEIDFIDDEAGKRGWVVVNMKGDWKSIYAPAR